MKIKLVALLAVPFLSMMTASLVSAGGGGSCNYSKSSSVDIKPDLVDAAISAGSFNTLVTALQEANLVQTLKGDGPFTVFAPNDLGFIRLARDLGYRGRSEEDAFNFIVECFIFNSLKHFCKRMNGQICTKFSIAYDVFARWIHIYAMGRFRRG